MKCTTALKFQRLLKSKSSENVDIYICTYISLNLPPPVSISSNDDSPHLCRKAGLTYKDIYLFIHIQRKIWKAQSEEEFYQLDERLQPWPKKQHAESQHCILVYGGSCQWEAVISHSPVMDFFPLLNRCQNLKSRKQLTSLIRRDWQQKSVIYCWCFT